MGTVLCNFGYKLKGGHGLRAGTVKGPYQSIASASCIFHLYIWHDYGWKLVLFRY